MSRARVAVALAVLAALCLAATVWVAVAAYLRDEAPAPGMRVVTDPGSGATFEVPRTGWRAGRAVAYGAARVDAPVLYRAGYCPTDPEGSFRALAGFTDQDFEAWVRGVGGEGAGVRQRVELDDGSAATLRSTRVPGGDGPCAAPGATVAMVTARGVRLVVVADTAAEGALPPADARAVLQSLQLP